MEKSTQDSSSSCPQCDSFIPADAPFGVCPKCLLAAGIQTRSGQDIHNEAPPSIDALKEDFPELELLELLGRGGMGAVYKARQKSLDRIVGLKLLNPGLDLDPGFSDRFTQEARTLAKLNHPGIVTVYESGQTESGRYFILMEYVDGVNLYQLLQVGRMSPREALAIVPPLCDALQYAHDHGLVHRDIKPENILVDRLGRVKIADFGLAKMIGKVDSVAASSPCSEPEAREANLTTFGQVMGTPEYMAPEQKSPNGSVDHRADIYALGVVLYQLLTGELPEGDLPQASRHLGNVQIDVRLDEVVLRALKSDPEDRYYAASEMKTQVQSLKLDQTKAVKVNTEGAPQGGGILASLVGFVFMFTLFCGALSFFAAGGNDLIDVHFNSEGLADASAPRQSYLFLMLILGVGMPGCIIGLCYIVRFMPAYLFNLPHRDFWLSPTRREWTHDQFLRFGINGSTGLLLVFLLCHLGLQIANKPGGRFPVEFAYGMLGAFALWMVFMVWRLWRMFAKQQEPASKRGVSWCVRFAGYLSPWFALLVIAQIASDLGIRLPLVNGATLIVLLLGCLLFGLWRTWRLHWNGEPAAQKRATAFWEKVVVVARPWVIFTTLACFIVLTLGTAFDIFRVPDVVEEPSRILLDDLSQETNREVLDLQSMQIQGLEGQFADEASLPEFNLLYHRVADVDGLSVEAIDERHFLVSRAESFKLAALPVSMLAESPDGAVIQQFLAKAESPAVEAGMVFHPIDTENSGRWYAFALTVDGGSQAWGVLRFSFLEDMRTGIALEIQSISFDQVDVPAPSYQIDRQGQTVGMIVAEINREYQQRISFEDIDYTVEDGLRLGAAIEQLESIANGNLALLSQSQSERLATYRRLLQEGSDAQTLIDVGTRYEGSIESNSIEGLLDQLTSGTPFKWERIEGNYVVSPEAGSVLDFPVTLNTGGLTLGAVIVAALKQAPEGLSINMGMLSIGPVAPGTDSMPWLSIQAPELPFEGVPCREVLTSLTSSASLPSTWYLAGYRGGRHLAAHASHSEALSAVNQAQYWLVQIDRGDFILSWENAAQFFRAQLTGEQWVQALQAVREPLGEVVSRRVFTVDRYDKLPGVPAGKYTLVTLLTEFEKSAAKVETLTLTLEEDGIWRVAGYFIKPRESR